MALETLQNVKEIGGFKVAELNEAIPREEWLELIKSKFVVVSHANNTIHFKIQNRPIKEVGVNGCQVDTLIHAAMIILKGLNDKYPCPENEKAIDYLWDAITELENRTKDRQARGVEGTSQA